jgi:outer membrane protein assembly factor BamA
MAEKFILNAGTTDPNKILPIKYKWARQHYKNGVANNWTPEEVNMQKDFETWKAPNGLTEDERRLILWNMGFFSTAESLTANNIVLTIYKHVTNPECRQYLLRQAYEEAVHGSVSKVNLFGRGYDISLSGLFSGKRQLFNTLFRNPRVYDSKYSLTLKGYNSEYQSIDETKVLERGGSVSVGYPLDKVWSVFGTYSLQHIDINIQAIIERLFPESVGLSSSLEFGITRDTLNTREIFLPTRGTLNQLSTTVASKVMGSDLSFWKTSFVSKRYFQVFDSDSLIFPGSVLSFGLRLDYLRGIENRSTPFNERFIPGGIYSIRGHLFRSLSRSIDAPFNLTGRRNDDSELGVTESKKLRLGGNKQAVFNVEYLFDIFKEAKIKGLLFFDAGNAFEEQSFNWRDIRYSTGFGFRWFSPLGPLRFEWGIPLDRKKDEDAILFDFSIGAPF